MHNVEPKKEKTNKKKRRKDTNPHFHPPNDNLKRCMRRPLVTAKFRPVKSTFCAIGSRNFVQWETKDVSNKQNLYCPQPWHLVAAGHPGTDISRTGAIPVRDALDFLPARKSSPCSRKSKGAFLLMLKKNPKTQTTQKQSSVPAAARLRPGLGELSRSASMRKSAILADVKGLHFAQTNQGKKVIPGKQLLPSLFC